MDTRTKIVGRHEAARLPQGAVRTVVTGYFDPLTAAHARRLAEIAAQGAPLLVVVRTPAHPILEARARAELVAALGSVAYVVIGGGDDAWLSGLPPAVTIREETADLERTLTLVRHIHQRQGAR